MKAIEKMFSLKDKVAVITGGGGVIASAMAEIYLEAGATVSLWNRTASNVEKRATALRDKFPDSADNIHTQVVDTGDEPAVSATLERTAAELGTVDILVNGVGGNRGKTAFVDTDATLFDEILRLNLTAGLLIPTKIVARWWIAQEIAGSIINLSSMASYLPLSGVWAYDAAKAGVLNLTAAAAKEFAPYGIRVNGIAPGFFLGRQNRSLLIDEESGNLTERGQAIIDHTPFGRFGEVSELAGTALFLASAQASGFITGVTIPVDGGYLIHNI